MQQTGFDASLLPETNEALPFDATTRIAQTPAAQDADNRSPSTSPCRATLNAHTRAQRRKHSNALTCNEPGCEQQTFSRKYELRRHIKTFHDGASGNSLKRFVCGAQGCFHKHSPRAFKRPDKLTSHIKACHRRDTRFTQCPVDKCMYGPATLEALGVHIRRLHEGNEAAHAVLNASTCNVYRCPIWTCKKHLDVRGLSAHLGSQHSIDEVYQSIQDLNTDGFVIGHSNGVPGFVLGVICPVCGVACENVEQFVKHIWSSHLYLASSDGYEHFVAWRADLAPSVDSFSQARVRKLSPWTQLLHLGFLAKTSAINCPACSFSVNFSDDWITRLQEQNLVYNHHLTLLRPINEVVAELYPYRFQILRLYPEFATHPVFADLASPQNQ